MLIINVNLCADFLSERSTVILVHLGGQEALRLPSYSQPKYENWIYAKTKKLLPEVWFGLKFFGQKIKVAHFCE